MKDLRTYLADLEAAGEILHIKKEVDIARNLGGLAWQAENYQGKAAMFENLRDYPGWKAISYLNGSRRRLAMSIGTTPDKFIPTWRRMLEKGLTPTKTVTSAPVQEVVFTGNDIDVMKMPVHTHSDLCAGPYIGGGLGIVKDPDTGIRNVSLHRHQVKGPDKLGVMMIEGRHMDLIRRKWDTRNEPCPIAIAIGHHGAYYLAANWTMSYGVDELELAGTLLGEPVEMVRCKTIDLEAPAHAEIVIEGLIQPNVREIEGPFAEHTGYARAGSGNNPFLMVTAITMRHDAIYYALQGGRPVSESQILDGMPMEVVLFDRLKDVGSYVDLKDVVALPCAGGSHILVVKMTPNLDGQARLVLMSALATQYIHTKIAIAVDDDVDPHSEKDLIWAISTRVNPQRDVFIVPDVLGHPLDASLELVTPVGYAPGVRVGSKMGIDATKPPTRLKEQRDHFTRAMPRGLHEYLLRDFTG